jgi:TonB family protein
MNSTVQQDVKEPLAEPHFLLEWEGSSDPGRWVRVGLLSLVFHLFLGTGVLYVASLPLPKYNPPENTANVRKVTPLIAPPVELTQKALNKAPLSKEFNLESIAPHPATRDFPNPGAAETPSRAGQKFTPPVPTRAPVPAPAIPDAPSIDTAQIRTVPSTNPVIGTTEQPAPPKIQPEENPKLAFEKPGVESGSPQGLSRIPVPKNTVDEAMRAAARNRGSHGLILGDDADAALGGGPSPKNSPVPGKLGSSLELLSDPMGVDFWPYLIKVLASVRRNWYAVIPESAKLGRGGRVVIQFAIARDGNVPKLVIAMPSGAEALDRAAVAGISASNPFPPLPTEFKGSQIRLQFAFQYSVAPR